MNELPKLPYGMGVYTYDKGKIRYRKSVKVGSRKVRVSVVGDTIQEVNRLMAEKEAEYNKRNKLSDIKSKTITLEHAMENWLFLYKKEEVNEKTFDRLESTFRNHIIGTDLGIMRESDIMSDDLQRHMKKIAEKGLSYSSNKKVYELLNGYFKHKHRTSPYDNPMIGVSKPKNNDKQLNEGLIVWNDDEMIALTKIAFEPYIAGKSGFRHGLVITFIMWSFIRIGEALALQWEDIDFENKTINITKQLSRVRDRKNGGFKSIVKRTKYDSARKFTLSNMAFECIEEYGRRKPHKPTDYILENNGKVVAMNTITNSYKAMIIKANLPKDKHVTIHGLRHSGISYMLRHNVPVEVVSKMAGHKTIKITLDTYYYVLEEQKAEAMERFNQENRIDFK